MANRFYKAGSNQYVSQFVPQQMPLDMMAQGLNNKQTQYNTTQSQILNARANFKQKAFGKSHEAELENITRNFDEFVEGSWDKDLTSPEFIREYQQFTSEFRNNPKLATIQSRMANVTALQEEKKELLKTEGLNSARYHRVDKQLQRALSDDDVFEDTLSDAIIGEEVDVRKTQEQYFNDLKANGSEWIDELSGVYYEKGWSGIKESDIGAAASRNFNSYLSTPAGRQEGMEYEFAKDNNVLPTNAQGEPMSKSEFIFDRFISTGLDFKQSKNTVTGKAAALNKAVDNAAEARVAQDTTFTVAGTKSSGNPGNWETNVGTAGSSTGLIEEGTKKVTSLEGNLDQYTSAQEFNVTEDNKNLVMSAPFGNLVAEGQMLTAEQSAAYRGFFDNQIKATETEIGKTNRWLEQEEVRMADALTASQTTDENLGSQEMLGGQTHMQAIRAFLGKEAGISEMSKITSQGVLDELEQIKKMPGGQALLASTGEVKIKRDGSDLTITSPVGDLLWTVNSTAMMMLDEAKDQLDDGEITADEYAALHKEISDFKTIGYAYEAKIDINDAMAEAEADRESPLRAAYNSINPTTIQAQATAKPQSRDYDVYNSSKQKSGKATNPAYLIESDVRVNSRNYSFTDEAGNPVDVRKYNLEKGDVVSVDNSNPNPDTQATSFSFSAPMSTTTLDPVSIEELRNAGTLDDENFRDGVLDEATLSEDQRAAINVKATSQRQLLTVNITDPYTEASILEARKQKEANTYRMGPDTKEGQDAFVRLMTLEDQSFGTDLEQANILRPNQSYPIRRTVYNIEEGQKVLPTELVYTTTKLPGEGANAGFFSVNIADENGNVINSNIVLQNVGELSSYIKSIEMEQSQWLQEGLIVPGEVFSTETK